MNEQWPEYWEKIFNLNGYVAIDCIRTKIWNNKKVERAYAQNILIYVKNNRLRSYSRLYKDFMKSKLLPLAIVHPEVYQHVLNRYQRGIKTLAKRLLLEIFDRIKGSNISSN